jgi:hypothetical protein
LKKIEKLSDHERLGSVQAEGLKMKRGKTLRLGGTMDKIRNGIFKSRVQGMQNNAVNKMGSIGGRFWRIGGLQVKKDSSVMDFGIGQTQFGWVIGKGGVAKVYFIC